MIVFEVNDMTCGHCVGGVPKAVQAVDPGAKVQVDLSRHRVEIEPVRSDAAALSDAIKKAGYTPVSFVASAASAAR